jgi:hypothetical protein
VIVLSGGRSLSSSSSSPGIGVIAWFLELGPVVWPVPPTTSGPDSGIFDASMLLRASGGLGADGGYAQQDGQRGNRRCNDRPFHRDLHE